MRCEQFEQRLNGLLDRRAIPSRDPLLRAHAHACSQCARLLRHEEELSEFLEHDATILGQGFTDGVMTALEVSPASSSRLGRWRRLSTWRQGRWSTSAAVAVVVLCLLSVWRMVPPQEDASRSRARVAVATPSNSFPQTAESPVRWNEPAAGTASHQLVTLASRRLEGADTVAATVASDLSPWARSIRSAFAALTSVWPGGAQHDSKSVRSKGERQLGD